MAWALDGGGPTLVKGGPGTGKSTVALYRVRAMVEALKARAWPSPRILFTTYTNALVTFSEQLLRSLLGDQAEFVDVRTADSIALAIVSQRMGAPRIASTQEVRDAMAKAMDAGWADRLVSHAQIRGGSAGEARSRLSLGRGRFHYRCASPDDLRAVPRCDARWSPRGLV